MGPELLESLPVDQLDLKHHNGLQLELMHQMIGENHSRQKQQAWVLKYSPKFRELINNPEYDEIRALALGDDYKQAAELLRPLLEE
ncbi:MAG: hypothetical protein Q7K65_02840 [Candidatus Buchananbacteria bacterium]|nr:hypothetical protein [Candidatus Buchananbacteria bacterium]